MEVKITDHRVYDNAGPSPAYYPGVNGRPGRVQPWGEWKREVDKKARLYFTPLGETVLENLFEGRRNRPVELFRSSGLLDEALTRAGIDPTTVRANWSKHAGCSMCPCSPGFIITGKDGSYPLKGKSISVTYAAADFDVDAHVAMVKARQQDLADLRALQEQEKRVKDLVEV